MLDLYLCFADRTEAVSVLHGLGIGSGDGELPVDCMVGGTAFALDLLFGSGTLREGDDGNASPLPGCHVNLRWRDANPPVALMPFSIAPVTPAVCWA